MKKLVLVLKSVLIAGLILIPATTKLVAQDVNNFAISDYDIVFNLAKDETGRSTLETTETIVADFPNYDQNRGIERALPIKYDGHGTSLDVLAVTDKNGVDWPYSTYKSNDNLVVRVGDPAKYAHGTQSYVITYTRRDVTRYFADSNSDEFYFDTNGTDWRVPISNLSVTLNLTPELLEALNGQTACYQGREGSVGNCQLSQTESGFYTSASNLEARENITIAVGFQPDTFTPYQKTAWEKLLIAYAFSLFVLGAVALAMLGWLTTVFFRLYTNRTDRTVVTEFAPPAGMSAMAAAGILGVGNTRNGFAAQLLDLAVRGYIKIYETKAKTTWKPAQYNIELNKDPSDLLPEEREILSDIFHEKMQVGESISLKSLQNNYSFMTRTMDNDKKLLKLTRDTYGWREQKPESIKVFKRWSWGFLIVGILLLNPVMLIGSIVLFTYTYYLGWSISPKGAEMRRHLLGLKQYIKVAEAERFKFLHSPQAVEKIGRVDTKDAEAMIKLHEPLLAYATLFSLEKEWGKELGKYYEQAGHNPSWYVGGNNAILNAAALSSVMNNLSTATAYTSAGSSGSGGSGGGGYSGGGGGGGGGGGW